MDLDEAAEELYALPPEAFVPRRQELVVQARADRDRDLVRALGALRRPTRTAWLVNLLSRHDRPGLEALFTLGEDLLEAQRRRAGSDLRRLSGDRRRQVDGLARRAVRLGAERGYQAPDGAAAELVATLQAALSDPAVADLVRRGRLTQAASYAGFGPGDLTAALAASLSAPAVETPGPVTPESAEGESAEGEPPEGEQAEGGPPEDERAERERAERERAERAAAQEVALVAARERVAQAEARAETAETQAAELTAAADALAERMADLQRRLVDAETEESVARNTARAARRQAAERQAEVQRARADLQALADRPEP